MTSFGATFRDELFNTGRKILIRKVAYLIN